MSFGLDTVIHGDAETTLQLYQALFDKEKIAILTLDDQGVITTISPAIERITEHPAPALIGTLLLGLIHEQYRDAIRQAHKTGTSIQREIPLITLLGERVWVRYTALPQANGQYYALLQEISTEREATQAIEDKNSRYLGILNTLPDMLLVINREGVITEAYADNSELQSETDVLQQKSLADTGLPPHIVKSIGEAITQTIDEQTIQHFTFTLQDGDYTLSYEVRTVSLNLREALILVRDMTPQHIALESLQERIDDLNIIRQVNLELGDTLQLNTVVQLGLDATQRITGASAGFLGLVQPDGTLQLGGYIGNYKRDYLEKLLSKRGGFIERALQAHQPEIFYNLPNQAHYVPLLEDSKEILLTPLRSNDRVVGFMQLESRRANRFDEERFDLITSVTGRVAAYLDNANLYQQTQDQLDELKRLYDEVRYLEQLKTDMIRIASHDLKNPLSGILGYVDLLREYGDNLTEEQQEYISEMRSAVRKMTRITGSILSLERIEHMAQNQTQDMFDFCELVEGCIAEHITYAGQKDQAFTFQLPKNQSIPVMGDPFQIHEALTNLISNAIKYTPNGGKIHIGLKQDGCQAIVRVVDTGFGIPKDQHDRIFSPFFRAHSKETTAIEGTGLGLHLVRNIIQRHKGQMIFNSIYGEGSTFGFMLPVHDCK